MGFQQRWITEALCSRKQRGTSFLVCCPLWRRMELQGDEPGQPLETQTCSGTTRRLSAVSNLTHTSLNVRDGHKQLDYGFRVWSAIGTCHRGGSATRLTRRCSRLAVRYFAPLSCNSLLEKHWPIPALHLLDRSQRRDQGRVQRSAPCQRLAVSAQRYAMEDDVHEGRKERFLFSFRSSTINATMQLVWEMNVPTAASRPVMSDLWVRVMFR